MSLLTLFLFDLYDYYGNPGTRLEFIIYGLCALSLLLFLVAFALTFRASATTRGSLIAYGFLLFTMIPYGIQYLVWGDRWGNTSWGDTEFFVFMINDAVAVVGLVLFGFSKTVKALFTQNSTQPSTSGVKP